MNTQTTKVILAIPCAIAILISCKPDKSQLDKVETNTAVIADPANELESNTKRRNTEAREDSMKLMTAYAEQTKIVNIIQADVETEPVGEAIDDDAADDPAFWHNKSNPDNSLIFGTNKKGGVYSYDLTGKEMMYYPLGEINNIDIRQGLIYNQDTFDILAGSNRTDNSIVIQKINHEGELTAFIPNHIIDTTLVDEVYGFCFYKNNGKLYYIVNGKNGRVVAYECIESKGALSLQVWQSWSVSSQPEGMVADDELQHLYIGEEEWGIWKVDLAIADAQPEPLLSSQQSNNSAIQYDIEGLSMFYGKDQSGFLLASIQGSFTYAIFDRQSNEYITSFSIRDNETIDGVEETDGLDIVSVGIGSAYPQGLAIFQDGFNKDEGTDKSQNFKLVRLDKILALLKTDDKTSN